MPKQDCPKNMLCECLIFQKLLFKFQWVMLFVCLIFGHIVKHGRFVKMDCLPCNTHYMCIFVFD